MANAERLHPYGVDPAGYQAMLALEQHLEEGKLERGLRQLVDLRVSQLNGCTYCLEMHTRLARDAGVSQEQLDLVAGWREATCFQERQRAALALAEAVTRIGDGGVTDELWAQVTDHFTDDEAAQLLFTIGSINSWNRINVAVRLRPRSRHGSQG
jgi:AhpD family alkylhydroperoxidase